MDSEKYIASVSLGKVAILMGDLSYSVLTVRAASPMLPG